jgi:hypothetical protein
VSKTVLEIAETPITDASELAERFRALCAVLPPEDGVRRFCEVHAVMSDAVTARLEQGGFLDAAGLERMDIHLVERFLQMVVRWERDADSIGKAWAPLFERRANKLIHPIRFAVAGIHAHVASDLVWAVLRTHEELGRDPELDSDLHKDYCQVNAIEGRLRDAVEAKLATPEFAEWDERLGPADDWFRSWSFARARDKAWLDAMLIARAPGPLAKLHFEALDRTTGFANRLFLR